MNRNLLLRYPPVAARSRVLVQAGALDRLGRFAKSTSGASRVALVLDARVDALYGACARRSLERAGLGPVTLRVPRGERAKRVDRLEALWKALARAEIARGDAIVALGGGAVCDLAGFAAATWQRGIVWLAVPTTLLAQVDASVGGKTGIDLEAGKNLVGAFHQPAGVLVDPRTLETLPARERRAGLAEVVKMGFATDAALFRWVERHADGLAAGHSATLAEAVRRAIRAKAHIVQQDEREAGARSALNFGHTLGHAIEASLGYRQVRHGEAVAIGMRAASWLSMHEAGLASAARARLLAVLDELGLPSRMPRVRVAALIAAMRQDKKRGADGVRWVLTPRMGHASVPRLMPGRLVRKALLDAGARA